MVVYGGNLMGDFFVCPSRSVPPLNTNVAELEDGE